jgi:serine phosphatase RsbU (regulator of sigma subunit)
MNIGNALAVLFSAFGLLLAALLVPQVQDSYRYAASTAEQIIVDQARGDVFATVLVIRQGNAALTFATGSDNTDDLLKQPADLLARAAEPLAQTDNPVFLELSDRLVAQAARLRSPPARLVATDDPVAFARAAAEQRALLVDVQAETLLIRQRLLQQIGIPDTTMGVLQLMRNYILTVSDALQTDLILADADAIASRSAIWQAQTSSGSLVAVNQFYTDLLGVYRRDITGLGLDVADYLRVSYLPTLNTYVAMIDGGSNVATAQSAWATALMGANQLLSNKAAQLFTISQAHLTAEAIRARSELNTIFVWAAFVAVLYLCSIYFVSRHIVRPLGYIQRRIVDIAEGRLDPIIKRDMRMSDAQSVIDALRVLRIVARRRERLSAERLELNEQIVNAHATLQAEVTAAANVQFSLLPKPDTLGHIRFSTLFQPSHMVAGDTYDFTQLSDQRTGLFLIDVAGHGAAAGLVSMAAHISARRALRSIKPGIDLAQAVATMNRHWSPELTYFTTVMAEFDSSTNLARLVQAGHPHPILIGVDGQVSRIGNGGLPIGVIGDADYEMITFPFTMGDRLLVFSDGLYENFDEEGEIFSEDRLIDLVQEHCHKDTATLVEIVKASVVSWTKSGVPSDDVSLVVAERI